MTIFREVLSRRGAVLVLGVFLALLGTQAFRGMSRSLYPPVDYPRVVVEVGLGFAPLDSMEWGVSAVLERELRGVPGVRMVKSSTSRGNSVIDVFLNESEDVTMAVQRVNAKIAEARALIPQGAEVFVRPITADAFPAAEYCFVSKAKNQRDLRTFVDYTMRPLIMVIPGIFDAKVLGGELPELSIEVDPKKLAALNLNLADLGSRIKNSNGIEFLGPIDRKDSQLLAFGGRFLQTPEELESLAVETSLGRSVRIKDIGRVFIRNEWKTKDTSLNGEECVALSIFYQSGVDQEAASVKVGETIRTIVEQNSDLIFRSWDLNDFTDAATSAVLFDLAAGMAIIALVTYLFLRNGSSSLIALLSMPLSGCLTFLVMSRVGLTINLMTLGGLAAAIGLVVDNTVIVLELFHHRKQENPGQTAASVLIGVLSSVAKPMIFGTVTIALVFTPISFLSGFSGMFFAPMSHVHAIALLGSVVIALLFVPTLISFEKAKPRNEKSHGVDFEKGWLSRTYAKLLKRNLRTGPVGLVLRVLIPLLGVSFLPLAQTGFLPEWDEGNIVVDFRAEEPKSLLQTVEAVKPIEKFIREIPEVDFFIRKVGTGLGELNHVPYAGEFVVKLKDDRKKSVFQVMEQISEEARKIVPSYEFDLFQILPDRLNDLSGTAKPIVLYVYADSQEKRDKGAGRLKESLTKVDGLDSVRIEEPEPADELIFQLDENIARGLEQDPSAIHEAIRAGLFSVDLAQAQVGPRTIPIRLRSAAATAKNSLEDVEIFTPRGGISKVSRLGRTSLQKARIEASHIDGTPVKTVTAEISGRDLGSVVKEIKGVIRKIETEGVKIHLAGDYEMQQRAFRELLLAFGTGILLIFLMALLFTNRIRLALPITVAALIPPSIGLMGCVLLGVPLDVSSFSGLISVTGIAVANSFMALSAIEEVPDHLNRWSEAVLEGSVSRFRPILMTSLAAMAGFVPIALGLARGDEILKPFSIAIICGLIGTMYSTLIVIPPLFVRFGAGPKRVGA